MEQDKINKYFNNYLKGHITYLSTSDIPNRYFWDVQFNENNECYFKKVERNFYAKLYRIEEFEHIKGDEIEKIQSAIDSFLEKNINSITKVGFLYGGCQPQYYTEGLFSIFSELK